MNCRNYNAMCAGFTCVCVCVSAGARPLGKCVFISYSLSHYLQIDINLKWDFSSSLVYHAFVALFAVRRNSFSTEHFTKAKKMNFMCNQFICFIWRANIFHVNCIQQNVFGSCGWLAPLLLNTLLFQLFCFIESMRNAHFAFLLSRWNRLWFFFSWKKGEFLIEFESIET